MNFNSKKMDQSFYIAESRFDELKTFIRTHTPTVRFKHNPIKNRNELFIALTMEVEDGNKLNELFEKWYTEDNPIKIQNKNILKRIVSYFK
jgi:uncharacterized protein with ACT and thioredoxin-like domain